MIPLLLPENYHSVPFKYALTESYNLIQFFIIYTKTANLLPSVPKGLLSVLLSVASKQWHLGGHLLMFHGLFRVSSSRGSSLPISNIKKQPIKVWYPLRTELWPIVYHFVFSNQRCPLSTIKCKLNMAENDGLWM